MLSTKAKTPVRVSIPSPSLIGGLSFAALLLASVSFAGQVYVHVLDHARQLPGLLHIDGENNIPAFFSMLLLLSASFLLSVIYLLRRRLSLPYTWHWLGLAIIFLCMALDEAIGLHEKLTGITQRLTGSDTGLFLLAWVVPVGVLLLGFGAAYFRFLWCLPFRHRLAFIKAGVLYVCGALGMEIVGGYYMQAYGWNLTLHFLMTLEESLEMFGVIALLAALLRYLHDELPDLTLHFGKGSGL